MTKTINSNNQTKTQGDTVTGTKGGYISPTVVNNIEYPINPELTFAKMDENAVIPSKKGTDAGYDIYACFENPFIGITPHCIEKIPTKIASAFSSDYVAVLKERSSVGSKNVTIHAGIIDSGYRGEWVVCLSNDNDRYFVIYDDTIYNINNSESMRDLIRMFGTSTIFYPKSKAICQMIMLPVPKMTVTEVSIEALLTTKSDRGTNGFGSSGK